MTETEFEPKGFVLRKDIHPIELWSPGSRVRIHVPAVPVAGTIIAGGLGALAGGAVVAIFVFRLLGTDPVWWSAIAMGAAAGALRAAWKFHDMFEEHDITAG